MHSEAPLLEIGAIASTDSLTICAAPEEVRRASIWLDRLGKAHAIPTEQNARLDLCLNEALGNILFHGGEGALSESVFLQLNISRNPHFCEASVTISDAGVKFDLLEAAPKTLPKSLADTQPGGLGLLMLRQFTDELHYCYRDGRNHLNFSVRWTVAPR